MGSEQSVPCWTGCCKFAREGMSFVRSDGKVSPCMVLQLNGYSWMNVV